jgi:Ca2+-transporting ATPase
VKTIFILSLFATLFLFVVTFLEHRNWTQSLIESLTFIMATIPEEFPLVFTLYLSLGAYRLSKHGVLIKSLPSVEALGGVDVICTDKTGTLTQGQFQLESLEAMSPNLTQEELWQIALMACEERPVDAMETALFEKGGQYQGLLNEWRLRWDYPFELKGKHMSHVWMHQQNNQTIMAMKGSVEGVLEHCEHDQGTQDQIHARVAFWAAQGKRLLGLATRKGACLGDRIQDEKNLTFVGLLIFSDPIRQSAKDAVIKCQDAGIEIKMLTGDHPLTAHAVADELGLIHSHHNLYTGDQLSQMSPPARLEAYQQGAIFSRVLPEQKYEMVQALKESGKVVAMTGDGINDAPALKIADIGISMGHNSTDVARSCAQMVLMKNDFQGIIEAVFEGRKIFSNLKRSFSYLISFHVPIVLFALVTPLLGHGALLLPIHMVLLQLVVHPVSAYSFENLAANTMDRGKSLMSRGRLFESLLSGLLLSLGGLFIFHQTLATGDIVLARSVAITSVMFGNIFFVVVESWPEVGLRSVLTMVLLLLFLVVILYVGPIASLFHLRPIGLSLVLLALFIGFLASLPTFILRHASFLRKENFKA